MTKAIHEAMPEYDYVYLGDTKRVPYGNRSQEAIFRFTREAMDFLFEKENCALVIIACNTVSARALPKVQKKYSKKILGVLIPTAEEGAGFKRIGVLGTTSTVTSGTFPREIKKLNKRAKIFQNPAPLLVPLAEEGEHKLAEPFLRKYLQPLLAQKIEALVLGCTHYPIFKKEIRKIVGKKVRVLSQDEIIPAKLKNYLGRHPEISKKLSRNGMAKIFFTDLTPTVKKLTHTWFGGRTKPKLVQI